MVDHVDKAKRSFIMASVHSEGTGPEKAVRAIVRRLGYRCRLHVKSLPGRPDLVFQSRRKIIFVHGCFWHRHRKCRYASSPKSRKAFWEAKFAANVSRDRRIKRALKRMGWCIMTVWQCELKEKERLTRRIDDFLSK